MNFEQAPCVVVGNLNIIRCLAMSRLPVVLAGSAANRPAFYSRFCRLAYETPSPTREPAAFVDSILEIGRRLEGYQPVLYCSGDADLISISANRDRLSRYYRFTMVSHDMVELFTDKTRFSEFAGRHNLPVPRTYAYVAGEELARVFSEVRYPCIVKPAARGDWFGSEIVRRLAKPQKAMWVGSADELRTMLPLLERSAGKFIIQELVRGSEANVLSYHCYMTRNGEILGEFTGRKIRTFPGSYGISSCVEVDDNRKVMRMGRDIVGQLGVVGASKLDFKVDEATGEIKLLEINPRFTLWNYPGAKAGVNIPALAYQDIVQRGVVERQSTCRNVKWFDFGADFRSFREAQTRGDLTLGAWLKSLIGGTAVHELWAWNDPMPYVAGLLGAWALAKCKAGLGRLWKPDRNVGKPTRSRP